VELFGVLMAERDVIDFLVGFMEILLKNVVGKLLGVVVGDLMEGIVDSCEAKGCHVGG
jgi:hypothetical protein